MTGLKLMCIKTEHLLLLDSVSFLPCPLPKLTEAYVLSASTLIQYGGNLNYVVPIPDVSYYGVNEMGEEERSEFLAWYESQKSELLDNRRVHEKYCQDHVTVLRHAFRVFRREFIQMGYIELFLESITMASA